MPRYITRTQVKRGARLSAVNNGRGVPYDIIAYIAGFLWDDMISLKNATLLSRSWRAASFSYLFRSISVYKSEDFLKLQNLLYEDKIQGAWVRELHFSAFFPLVGGGPGWEADIFSSLPSKLPHLYNLTLSWLGAGYGQTIPHPDEKEAQDHVQILSSFASVKELTVKISHCTPWMIWATASAFPNLKHLELQNEWLSDSTKGPPLATLQNVSLSSLNLLGDAYGRFHRQPVSSPLILDYALQSRTAETIRSLSIAISKRPCYIAMVRFLQCVGPRLIDLDLKLDYEISKNDQGKTNKLDLSHCLALETVTLHNPGKPSTLELVSQLSPVFKRLHWLLFDIRFDNKTLISEKDCKKMDERLSRTDAQVMREIAFRYEGKVEFGKAKRKICRLFSSISAQGNMEIF